jgi:hypothetical protein
MPMAGGAAIGAADSAVAAQAAARAVARLAANDAERAKAWGNRTARGLPSALNRLNPACAPNMCFPSAIAQDLTLETGNGVAAQPFAGNVTLKVVGGVPTNVFNLTTDRTVNSMLSSLYGSRRMQGPALDATRLANQRAGVPSVMPSAGAISRELEAAGPGARGLAFIEYAPTAAEPDPVGHVINTINNNGIAQAIDASNSGIDASTFFDGASRILFYRTK